MLNRRDLLKLASGTLASGMIRSSAVRAAEETSAPVRRRSKAARPKKVIVAGGGIGGLCCAYELMMRGHEVILFEAAGRTGGHVKTIHDPLADGLYADVGAEHFTKPGYDLYWGYVREFNLTPLYYPHREHVIHFINGKRYTDEDLADAEVLTHSDSTREKSTILNIIPGGTSRRCT